MYYPDVFQKEIVFQAFCELFGEEYRGVKPVKPTTQHHYSNFEVQVSNRKSNPYRLVDFTESAPINGVVDSLPLSESIMEQLRVAVDGFKKKIDDAASQWEDRDNLIWVMKNISEFPNGIALWESDLAMCSVCERPVGYVISQDDSSSVWCIECAEKQKGEKSWSPFTEAR